MTRIKKLTMLAGAVAMTMSALAFAPAQAAPNDDHRGGQSSSHNSFGGGHSGSSGFSGFHANRQFRFSSGPQLPDHPAADPSCLWHHNIRNPAWGCEAM